VSRIDNRSTCEGPQQGRRPARVLREREARPPPLLRLGAAGPRLLPAGCTG